MISGPFTCSQATICVAPGEDVPFVRIQIPQQTNIAPEAQVYADKVAWDIDAPKVPPEGRTIIKRVINFRIVASDSKPEVTEEHQEFELITLDPPIRFEVPFTWEDVEAAGGLDRLKLACDTHDADTWSIFGEDPMFGAQEPFKFWLCTDQMLGIVDGISVWVDPHIMWVT